MRAAGTLRALYQNGFGPDLRLDRAGTTPFFSLEGTATVVPEPSALVLLTLGAA